MFQPTPVVTSPTSHTPGFRPRPHLAAALCALSFLVVAAIGFGWWGKRAERAAFLALLPVLSQPRDHTKPEEIFLTQLARLKNQGVALQRRAFERDDILPLYGSSEMVRAIPGKANLFFRHFPTGFSVFLVGKNGTSPLIILQKIAAVGEATRGRRVAISLSPSWFFPGAKLEREYTGNFSRQQAFAALLNPALSFGFKRDFARSLLAHPATLQRETLLRFLVGRVARGGRLNRLAYTALWPLARLNQEIYAMQDHFENALYVKLYADHLGRPAEVIPTPLDWDRLLADAAQSPTPAGADAREPAPGDDPLIDQRFRQSIGQAPEWQNLELLLRGLHELRLMTLVLCMPPDGSHLERLGVAKESLDLFTGRIRALATHYGAQVEVFEAHEEDPGFFSDHYDHLSTKGWMYYNRALDEFYHTNPALLEATFAKGHHKRLRAAAVHPLQP
jgi:D-alanine transfer protein